MPLSVGGREDLRDDRVNRDTFRVTRQIERMQEGRGNYERNLVT